MCGIGGVLTKSMFTDYHAMLCVRLLGSLERRGKDAWGYFDGEKVHKEPGDFRESGKASEIYEELQEGKTNKFACHTRHATRGDPMENQNNHPFELGPFVFAHNGVLLYTDPFDNPTPIETDSFWMLYWIDEEYKTYGDTVKAIQEGVGHVLGWYACWLYNKEEEVMYLFRVDHPFLETLAFKSAKFVMFGSDLQSIADAFGTTLLQAHRLARVTRPYVIYRIKEGTISKVGSFTPLPVKRGDLIYFESMFWHVRKYHRRVLRWLTV